MKKVKTRNIRRLRRKRIIRKNIFGTKEVPRLTVFKSNKFLYVQAIDDNKEQTIASASNITYKGKDKALNVKTAEKIGEDIGKKLISMKINKVVFDRNGFLYAGRIKALADGARKAGLKF